MSSQFLHFSEFLAGYTESFAGPTKEGAALAERLQLCVELPEDGVEVVHDFVDLGRPAIDNFADVVSHLSNHALVVFLFVLADFLISL